MVYVADERYSIQRVPRRREWNLLIKDVQKADGGVYECQISSRYKLIHHIMLTVNSRCARARARACACARAHCVVWLV